MPRFFLHLYNDRVSKDDEGVELPDEAGRLLATITFGDAVRMESGPTQEPEPPQPA